MGRIGRSRKVISMDENHEFFKVYLTSLCSYQMCIPPAFVPYFDGKIPYRAVLKDHTGSIWHVGLEQVERDLVIRTGWVAFARDHCLGHGDFLHFTYDGNSEFSVKIFGKNGCKKRQWFNKIQKKEEQVETEENDIKSTRALKRKYDICASSSQVWKNPKGTPVASRTAHFVHHFTKSSKYNIYLPQSVIRDHNIKLKEEVMLRDENGKLWPILVRWRTNERVALGTGWVHFARKNKMRIGDKCVFEFIHGVGRNTHKEIKVKIIRASQRTT